MAVSTKVYAKFFTSAFNKLLDVDSDALKAVLLTSAYTPGQTTHDFYDDLTNELSTANGYTAGGVTLTTVTVTPSSLVITIDCDDIVWTATAGNTITARYCVIYDSTPATAATKPLICYIDFGADVSATGAALTITINASGLATVTCS